MKKTLLIVFVFLSFSGIAQNKFPPEVLRAEKLSPTNFEQKEVWIEWPNTYIKKYDQTPVGVKHVMEDLTALLKLNNLKFIEPTLDETMLASYVKDYADYKNINTSVIVGDSEIKKTWSTGKESYISIDITTREYNISVTKK